MKRFAIASLSVIFVALIACSAQSIYADHILKDGFHWTFVREMN